MKKLLYALLMTCSVPLLPSSSSSSSEDKSYLKLLDASEKLRTLVLSTEPDNYHRQRFEKLLWAVAYVQAGKKIDSVFTAYLNDNYWTARYDVINMTGNNDLYSLDDVLDCSREADKITQPLIEAFERYIQSEELRSKLVRQKDTQYNKLKRSQSF